jgi:1-acyl-sn-glycerol-3-phosphate acyltransferase
MRVFLKTFLILLSLAVAAFATWCIRCIKPARWYVPMNICSKVILAIIGVRCVVQGAAAEKRPLLLVTNHTSYLDILLLGSLLPVRFTPKSEIARWPVIGSVCRLTGCVFIERRATRTTDNQDKLLTAMEEGAMVSLFPEGTTNDGRHILPFRSSFFSLAERNFGGTPLKVQPAVIRYTHINGMPIGYGQMPMIAWYGDMALLPHAAQLLKLGAIRAEVIFLEPVDISAFENRKALAAHCQSVIEKSF